MKGITNLEKLDICILTNTPNNILEQSIKAWLLHSFEVKLVETSSFDLTKKFKPETLFLFLLLKSNNANNEISSVVNNIRSKGFNNHILVIDFDNINITQVRHLLAVPNCSIVNGNASEQQILNYLQQLLYQERVISSDIQERIIDAFLLKESKQQKRNSAFDLNGFSKLEQAIIDMAIKGFNIQETAAKLELSPNTIAVYRSKMLRKSGLGSFVQLVSESLKQ